MTDPTFAADATEFASLAAGHLRRAREIMRDHSGGGQWWLGLAVREQRAGLSCMASVRLMAELADVVDLG